MSTTYTEIVAAPVTAELKAKLEAHAKAQDRSVAWLTRKALEELLEREGEK